jgi:hypothetical protein
VPLSAGPEGVNAPLIDDAAMAAEPRKMPQVHHLPPEKAQRTPEAARLPFRVQLVQTLGSATWANS